MAGCECAGLSTVAGYADPLTTPHRRASRRVYGLQTGRVTDRRPRSWTDGDLPRPLTRPNHRSQSLSNTQMGEPGALGDATAGRVDFGVAGAGASWRSLGTRDIGQSLPSAPVALGALSASRVGAGSGGHR